MLTQEPSVDQRRMRLIESQLAITGDDLDCPAACAALGFCVGRQCQPSVSIIISQFAVIGVTHIR